MCNLLDSNYVICFVTVWPITGALGALGGGGVNSFPQKHNEKLYWRV